MFRFAQHDKVKAEDMTARHSAVSREKTNARNNVSFTRTVILSRAKDL
jgi:hypothetical protein